MSPTRRFTVVGEDREPTEYPEHNRGQLRFAERFVREHSGRLLHVHGIGWHTFDGNRWAACLDGGETRGMVATVKQALEDLPSLEEKPRNELIKDIQKVESHAGIRGVLGIAGNLQGCTLAAEALDAAPNLLNTASGTVDLRDGSAHAADPNDLLSKVTGARFDPDARSEMFDGFLARIQPDPEMRAFLARSLGSALLGMVRDHVLLIWHGTGANGKGTLRDAVLGALGDYAIEVRTELLMAQRHTSSIDDLGKLRLKGARVAFCSEINEGARMDESTMKRLTGGDPIEGKQLYQNSIVFQPSHTLFMLTNFLPKVRGDDPATWRRILAVPFDEKIPREEWDTHLKEKMRSESDAVLAWLWKGWLDYQKNGLNPPEPVLADTRRYQQDSDILARFLADESAVLIGHGSALAGPLYEAFLGWARREGEPSDMSKKSFGQELEKRGFSSKRTNSSRSWQGILLIPEDQQCDQRGGDA